MRAVGIEGHLGANLFVARLAFKHDELRILVSEFDKISKEHTRDIDL